MIALKPRILLFGAALIVAAELVAEAVRYHTRRGYTVKLRVRSRLALGPDDMDDDGEPEPDEVNGPVT